MQKFTPLVMLCVITAAAFAQEPAKSDSSSAADSAMQQKMRELEDRVIALEGQIRLLKAAQAQPAAPAQSGNPAVPSAETAPSAQAGGLPSTQPAPVPAVPQTQAQALAQEPTLGGAGGSAAKALNPDISVIGDFIGALGGNSQQNTASLQPIPAFQMHESEVGFQSIIDPYARGDFFISFGEEGVNLEEGYITFTAR